MNINNNTTPFISITWHQKEPLGCFVFSHCSTNDSYNKCIHSCCLPCNYVTKPFGILQRVIKNQKVCVSFVHSKIQSFFSQKNFWLNVQTCFYTVRSNENVLSSLSIWGNALILQTAHRNFIILCQTVWIPNKLFNK